MSYRLRFKNETKQTKTNTPYLLQKSEILDESVLEQIALAAPEAFISSANCLIGECEKLETYFNPETNKGIELCKLVCAVSLDSLIKIHAYPGRECKAHVPFRAEGEKRNIHIRVGNGEVYRITYNDLGYVGFNDIQYPAGQKNEHVREVKNLVNRNYRNIFEKEHEIRLKGKIDKKLILKRKSKGK